MIFKINGERNSGTTFLMQLLQANFGQDKVYDQHQIKDTWYYWKHGVPDPSVKKMDARVVDVFIFRDLAGWLRSMFHNPYELEKLDDFQAFLTHKQTKINTIYKNHRTNGSLNEDDLNKTIFEIRYHKYQASLSYFQANKDVVFVNLAYLQNPHTCSLFLDKLAQTYDLKQASWVTSLPHTKTNMLHICNRQYEIEDFVASSENKQVEQEINKLEFIIK
jgi:uncharacterized protein (DUF1810 family)